MRISDWSSDVCSSDLGHLDHLTQCGGYFYVARAGRHAPARRSFRRACIEIAGPAGCGPKPPRLALGKAVCIAQFDRAEGAYEKMGGAGERGRASWVDSGGEYGEMRGADVTRKKQ